MKAKVFSIDTTTFSMKAVDFNFYVDIKHSPENIKASMKEIMSSIGKQYSIFVSPKEREVDDDKVKMDQEIKEFLEKSLGKVE